MRATSFVVPLTALIAGAAVSECLYRSGGASVDLFVTVTLAIALLSPLTVTWSRSTQMSLLNAAALSLGLMVGWFLLAMHGSILWENATRAGIVGLSIGLALAGIARLLSGGSGSARLMPGVVSVAGLAWVTWPVWLSIPLAGKSLSASVAIQPLFGVNDAVLDLGNWVDQPMAYQLTTFGQDVLYRMPHTIWPAVVFHGAIAIATWTPAFWMAHRRKARVPQSS